MKKQVWENKYNKQLCVTIPKGSGIKSGDVVSIEKEKIKNIVYSFVVADMFHYGHLQLLEKANELARIMKTIEVCRKAGANLAILNSYTNEGAKAILRTLGASSQQANQALVL